MITLLATFILSVFGWGIYITETDKKRRRNGKEEPCSMGRVAFASWSVGSLFVTAYMGAFLDGTSAGALGRLSWSIAMTPPLFLRLRSVQASRWWCLVGVVPVFALLVWIVFWFIPPKSRATTSADEQSVQTSPRLYSPPVLSVMGAIGVVAAFFCIDSIGSDSYAVWPTRREDGFGPGELSGWYKPWRFADKREFSLIYTNTSGWLFFWWKDGKRGPASPMPEFLSERQSDGVESRDSSTQFPYTE